MSLPSETFTFLFTDIEGSTRLWEKHPEAMRLALARHDALLRQVIEDHNGIAFKTIGDAFCAAFHTVSEALNAAITAQQALCLEPWPEAMTLKVRMALHLGTVELRENDFFGQPLNRIALLLSAAHGGQVLLSMAIEEMVRDTLPPPMSLHSLGEHRLRDLDRPETIYQLLHPDLPAEFPPLKSHNHPDLPNSADVPNNLPQQLTSFIGREKEIVEIRHLLSQTHLLTLTGSGGAGKTRLSLQVAAETLQDYPDGVWLVELAPLTDPALVPQTVASVLGQIEQAGKAFTQVLAEHLKTKKTLLLLDNCEHVLTACALLTDMLIRSCPEVKILASSREGLGIAGEQTYRMPSLSLPDLKQPLTADNIRSYEAVRLFVERAMLIHADFVVTDQNAPALASICHRLDGIPLALELAAARVRSLTVEEINNNLDDRFRFLTGGSKTALPRHQTLAAAIGWSYDLLNPQERTLLACLSVFLGGWTLKAAEAVGAGEHLSGGESIEDWEVLDLLTSLVDKSLVIAETGEGQTRYRLLETVRQYARDRLVQTGDSQAVRERHRDYFLALVEEIQPKLEGPEQGQWLNVLETEHDNLRLAVRFCLEEPDADPHAQFGLRLGVVLRHFWNVRGHLSEGRELLHALLAHPAGQEPTETRATALNGAGNLASAQGDSTMARALHEDSRAIAFAVGYQRGIAISLLNLGNVALAQGDQGLARSLYEECMAMCQERGEKKGITNCLMSLANLALAQCDYTLARSWHEKCLTTYRELEDRRGIASSLLNLGAVVYCQGEYMFARSLFEETLRIWREIGDKQGVANSLLSLGSVVLVQGDHLLARSLFEECLRIYRDVGDKRGIAESLEGFAFLARKEGRDAHAVRLWATAAALRISLGVPTPPNRQEDQDLQMADVRGALGEAAFAAAWAEGCALTLEGAIDYALQKPTS
ncbi:MAG: putative ATPase [Chthonomonadales bacterium]|nr:putative ATPase [Chthonomonadales bacterium]